MVYRVRLKAAKEQLKEKKNEVYQQKYFSSQYLDRAGEWKRESSYSV